MIEINAYRVRMVERTRYIPSTCPGCERPVTEIRSDEVEFKTGYATVDSDGELEWDDFKSGDTYTTAVECQECSERLDMTEKQARAIERRFAKREAAK